MTLLLTTLSVVSMGPLVADANASTPHAQELAKCASLYPVVPADYHICIGQIGIPNVPQN